MRLARLGSGPSFGKSGGQALAFADHVLALDYLKLRYRQHRRRTNLILHSQDLSQAVWGKTGQGTGLAPVVTANYPSTAAPDGTFTASRVQFDRGTGTTSSDRSRVFQTTTGIDPAGRASVWMRTTDGSSRTIYFQAPIFNGVAVTGEWKRFEAPASNANTTLEILIRGDNGAQTADILVWGVQRENNGVVTDYIPTTTTQRSVIENIYREGAVTAAGPEKGGVSGLYGYVHERTGGIKLEIEGAGLGPELVTNGDMSSATGWILDAGAAISGGQLSFTALAAAGQAITTYKDRVYIATYTVVTPAAGVYLATAGGDGGPYQGPTRTAAGTYTEEVRVTGASNTVFRVIGNNGSVVDNVSLKEFGVEYAEASYLGDELVTNGGFDTDTAWTKQAGWAISDGKGVATNASSQLFQSGSFVAGRTYRRTYTISNYVSGTVEAYAGVRTTADSGNGTYTRDLVSDGNGFISFLATNFTGTVDNITVREVIPEAFESYPANVPGIVRNVGMWSRPGLTNLVQQSQAFDAAAWSKYAGGLVATANTHLAPDGTATADTLTEGTGTAVQSANSSSVSFTAGAVYTASCYAKQGVGSRKLTIYPGGAAVASSAAFFDLGAGTVAGVISGTGANATAAIVAVGGGWYRCSMTFTCTTTNADFMFVGLSAANVYHESRVGDGTSALRLWQAQLVEGSLPGPVIATATATAAHGADNGSLQSPVDVDEDFMLWATVDLRVTAGIRALLTISDGTENNRIMLRQNDGAFGIQCTNAAVVNFSAGFDNGSTDIGLSGLGKCTLLLCRRAGKWVGASKSPSGVVTIRAESAVVAFPSGLHRLDVGRYFGIWHLGSPVQYVGCKKGTFSNTDISNLLATL